MYLQFEVFVISSHQISKEQLTNLLCHSPNKIFAVTTECRMLEESGDKFMILDFVDVFLLESPFPHF